MTVLDETLDKNIAKQLKKFEKIKNPSKFRKSNMLLIQNARKHIGFLSISSGFIKFGSSRANDTRFFE